jgi:glycosyltransferase involved in cell wall biosynthesis
MGASALRRKAVMGVLFSTEKEESRRTGAPVRPSLMTIAKDAASGTGRRKSRVLLLIDRLCVLGGAEKMLIEMARRLPSLGFECGVVALDPAPQLSSYFDCPFEALPLRKTWTPHGALMGWKLARLARAGRYGIVHTFFPSSDLWGGPIVKLATGARLISSRRDLGHMNSGMHRIAYRLMTSVYDQIHTVSGGVRDAAIEAGQGWAERTFVVYNGIDLETLDRKAEGGRERIRAALGIAAGTPVAVAVGNPRPVKGIDILIEAAATVCRHRPETVFLVAGAAETSAYGEQLGRMVSACGLNAAQFRFLGSRSDIPALLAASDIFVMPSRAEGFSNALLEAMAMRLACVATAVGGNPEAIRHQENGLLTEVGRPDELSKHFMTLLADPALRSRLGSAARRTVEQSFSIEATLNRVVNLYESLS